MVTLDGVKRDVVGTSTFAITNFTEDYSFDANTATLADTSDVLATLLRELARKGIINASVA